MEKAEKIGLGVAAAAMLGLLLLFAGMDTGPEVELTSRPARDLGDAKVATITRGAAVDIAAYLPDEGRTLVEFTAEW